METASARQTRFRGYVVSACSIISLQNRMPDLKQFVEKARFGIGDNSKKSKRVIAKLLAASTTIDRLNFDSVAARDLEILFSSIDQEFFGGKVAQQLAVNNLPLSFRVSKRMTNSGGITTTRFDNRTGKPKEFEIAISSTLLFESFKDEKPIVVTGLLCGDRTQALKRIMEHELIHLLEMLLWSESSCARARFQNIAFRLFRHRQSTHQLITPSDTAESHYNISAGDWVHFSLDDKTVFGFVNRITKRATILVPSKNGTPYSDGKKYLKYYVPVNRLRKAA